MNLPDFKTLDNEQKKKLMLAAILGVMVVYGLVTLVITPYIQSSRAATTELSTLQVKLDKAQGMLSRESRIRELTTESIAEIQKDARQYVPPLDNPLSWVAGQVYGSARSVGVDIESVSDLGVVAAPWSHGKEFDRAFVPYAVRIVTECGYSQLVGLITSLEKNNPFLCITEIQVTARNNHPDEHKIRMTVQWPYWSDPQKAMEVMNAKGVDRG